MKTLIRFLSISFLYFTLARVGHIFLLSDYNLPLLLLGSAYALVVARNRSHLELFALFAGAVGQHYFNMYLFKHTLPNISFVLLSALFSLVGPVALGYKFDFKKKDFFFNSWEKFFNYSLWALLFTLLGSLPLFYSYGLGLGIEADYFISSFITFYISTFFSVVIVAPILLFLNKQREFLYRDSSGVIELVFIGMFFILSFAFTGGHSVFALKGDVFFLVFIQLFFCSFLFFSYYFFYRFLVISHLKSLDYRHLSASILCQILLLSFYISFYLFDLKTGSSLSDDRLSIISIFLLFVGLGGASLISALFYALETTRLRLVEVDHLKKTANNFLVSKSVFLSNMGLEIRNPMNGILGLLEVLQEGSLTKDQKTIVNSIKSSSLTLLATVNDILDFSKFETNSFKVEEKNFILTEVVSSLCEYFTERTQDKNLSLKLDFNDNLPVHLKGDGDKLRQLIKNLLDNAIKFSNFGEILLRIKLLNDPHRDENYEFEFTVSDQGIGIPKSRLQNIFKPLQSVDSMRNRPHGGSGLGLVVCQKIVQLMGGTIEVNSEIGKGTSFKVYLDFSKGDLAIESTVKLDDQGSDRFASRYPAQILVVEDNPINRDVLVRFLTKFGYEPEIAQNGKEACEAFLYKNYDLVLMDLEMPVLNGIEATKIILRDCKQKKRPAIIALTANVYEKDKESCFEIGMVDFLLKPIDRSRLQTTLEKHLIIRLMDIGTNK